jgi:thioredoxin reductase
LDEQTGVAGVYAAGDMRSESRHVITAAAQGAVAAESINLLLSTHDFER